MSDGETKKHAESHPKNVLPNLYLAPETSSYIFGETRIAEIIEIDVPLKTLPCYLPTLTFEESASGDTLEMHWHLKSGN